jgi:3'-phosphoadenosine 5'-phosphosulfate sulfotransferase (PAPS reductase)/FAD synthetase
MSLRVCSYGGGVQSTALLVLAATGRIDFPLFLFANVGDRAENPDTIAYYAQHARPYAAAYDIDLVQLRWIDRNGMERDLYDDLLRQERSLTIPLRDSGGFMPRKCTERYKVGVVARELRRRGATPEVPAVVALGISTDEYQRAKVGIDPAYPWTAKTNPLLDLGLSRTDCRRVIADAGLPVPPKSSCWFCPMQRPAQWRERKRRQPDLYARAVALDELLAERHATLDRQRDSRERGGLASSRLPLDEAIEDGQLILDGMDGCDSGWCMT